MPLFPRRPNNGITTRTSFLFLSLETSMMARPFSLLETK